MNMSALCRQGPSSTCLPSIRTSLQSADSAPWAVIRLSALDLPPPGSPPISMLRSARLTWTCSPFSSMPRWIGSKMENGNTRTVVMAGCSLPGSGDGQAPADVCLGRCPSCDGWFIAGGVPPIRDLMWPEAAG